MLFTRKSALLGILMMLCLAALAACKPTPAPVVSTQTVQPALGVDGGEGGKVVSTVEKRIVVEEATDTPPEPTKLSPPEPTGTLPAEPKTYRIGLFEDLTTTNYWAHLDPQATVGNAYVLGNMHPALYRLAYPNALYVPQMATGLPEPAAQEDGFWVTEVKIRQGVEWSDGKEVTVHDLIFAADTCLEFGLSGDWLTNCRPQVLDHIEAMDDYTAKVYFKQEPGLAVWQYGVGLHPFMPEHFWADVVAECRNTPDPAPCLYAADGSGEPSALAFVFDEWEVGVSAELVANEGTYWKDSVWTFYADGSFKEVNPNGDYELCIYGNCSGEVDVQYPHGPFASGVAYHFYESQDAAVMALANNEVDFLLNPLGLRRDFYDQVVNDAGLDAFQNPSNGLRYLAFNLRKSPNDIKEFRQAVAYLIDKEYIAGNALQHTAIPVYGMVPEGNTYWHNPDVPTLGKGMGRSERIARAVELLKSAGFSWDVEPGFDEDNGVVVPGSRIRGPSGLELAEIELLAPNADYDPLRATASIWIAQWCNEVGIPVEVSPSGIDTIVPRVFEPDPETGEIEFDWYILGWNLGSPARPAFHRTLFSCDSEAKDGGSNTSGYCDEEFDFWAAAFDAARTNEEAREIVHKMEHKLAEDVPYVTLFSEPILEFYAKARVEYPFVETLDGLQNLNGAPDLVVVK